MPSVEASFKLIYLWYIYGYRGGVAGLVVTDSLDALPHALGIRVGEVNLQLQLVALLGHDDAPPQTCPG